MWIMESVWSLFSEINMDMFSPWVIVLGMVVFLYLYGKRRNAFFKSYRLPGPAPKLYIGNLNEFAKVDFDCTLQKKYGRIFTLFLGGFPMINVADPDVIKEILVKRFHNFTDRMTLDLNNYPVSTGLFFERGAAWKRVRRVMSAYFKQSCLRKMCGDINGCSKMLATNLKQTAETESQIVIKEYLERFTMNVILKVAFSMDESLGDISELLQNAKDFFKTNTLFSAFTIILPEMCPVLKAMGCSGFRKDVLQYFARFTAQVIQKRKKDIANGQKFTDFLQILLDAEDIHSQDKDQKAIDSDERKTISMDEITGQVALFFAAGFETSSGTLHYIIYCLATHPEVQDRLLYEIDTVLGQEEPDYDNIRKLKYIDCVINETLRIYPVVPRLNRVTNETCNIKGYTFPKGAVISIPTYQIHRDPTIYPEPHKFDPNRWINGMPNADEFLPFGRGQRQCLATRMVYVLMKLALVQVFKKVKFASSSETPPVLEGKDMDASSVLATKQPLKVKVQTR